MSTLGARCAAGTPEGYTYTDAWLPPRELARSADELSQRADGDDRDHAAGAVATAASTDDMSSRGSTGIDAPTRPR